MTRRRGVPARIGPYAILDRLAKGDVAEVFRAQRAPGEPIVCLKRIRSEYGNHEDFVALFVAEVELASRLTHPNIVPVYDHGEDGGYYLVMEWVDGGDLAQLLDRAGPLEAPVVAHLGAALARALVYVHHGDASTGRGPLVHHDVTPHNVLLSRQGAVKLSDFGLARVLRQTGDETLTRLRGKPSYLAPEQWLGDPVGSRVDLFGLGLVLWRALVGTHPYAEGRPPSALRVKEWIRDHTITNHRRSLAQAAPEAPEALQRAIEGLLQPVATRTPSAEALLEALAPIAGDASERLPALVGPR
ncbi:MAG: serine/threonine protein kinase [Sandaracinaceae bacterium]|nr:serine/threonine protein kinase [Sandaracinaceae bacterium]